MVKTMKCKMNYSSDTDIGENVLLTGAELRKYERAERDIVVLAGTCLSPEKFIVKFRDKRKGVFPDFF